MKRLETTEKTIGEHTFYLRPFPAFTAANISGELAALITPMLSGLAPLFGGDKSVSGIMDIDVEDAMPAISDAFSGISGDKFEKLMKKLLVDHKNITVEDKDTGKAEVLTMDLANEVFCGDVQDMYILCFEVIKINFGGFFKKLGGRFGNLQTLLATVTPRSESTET